MRSSTVSARKKFDESKLEFIDNGTIKLGVSPDLGGAITYLSKSGSDENIINNLGMEMQVVNAGSEEAIVAALTSAHSREEPIVFYFWTPHSIHAQYDLVQVELPAYSDECYADEAAVDCAYPKDELLKITPENYTGICDF